MSILPILPRLASQVRLSRLITLLTGGTLLPALLGCAPQIPPHPSLLVVSADSLRVDRLRPWNPREGVAVPALEALAERGTRFEHAWAASPWTAPSLVSLFTGLDPPSHGVAYRDDTTPRNLPTLPRLLGDRGYRLGNFSFFSGISYFRNLGLPPPEAGLSHDQVAASFRRWLAAGEPERPFFAWLHLLEPHLPYGATGYQATGIRVPGSSGLEQAQLRAAVPVGTAEFAPGDRDRLLALYDRDLAAMDRALGEILDALTERGLADSTVVVFVADHGEELLEHGWIGHASTAIEAKLVPEVLRVPLVLAGPGVPQGQVRRELVQPVDAFASLLELLDLQAPPELDGVTLPGVGGGWRRWFRRGRRQAFFDSSPGGNLTPVERRGERLQGVTDGDCLLASRLVPGQTELIEVTPLGPEATCGAAPRQRLESVLAGWRRRQAVQRLAILARGDLAEAPAAAVAETFAPGLRVLSPTAGETLTWEATRGQVTLEWQAAPAPGEVWWVVYEAGSGLSRVEGSFAADQSRLVFGPFPQGFWNDLASYSPFRFRVVDSTGRRRSEWVEFTVAPTG